MKSVVFAATLAALVTSTAGAQVADPPGLPVTTNLPSINSIRPGIIAAGSGDTTLTIYGLGYLGPAESLQVLWNGTTLAASAIAGQPDTQIVAAVPAALLVSAATATVAVRRVAGPATLDSNEVSVIVGSAADPNCASSRTQAACGAALGDIPTLEIVPVHTWYPFISAPSGGLVRVENRDFAAQFGHHVFASATLGPGMFAQITSGKITGDGRFNLNVPSPSSATDAPVTGYVQVPSAAPGTVIPFYCPAHNLLMATPVGGLLVQ